MVAFGTRVTPEVIRVVFTCIMICGMLRSDAFQVIQALAPRPRIWKAKRSKSRLVHCPRHHGRDLGEDVLGVLDKVSLLSCRFWNCMLFDCVVFAFGAWTTLEKWVMCFKSSLLVVILYSVSEGETIINQSFNLLTTPKQFPRYDTICRI